MRRIVRRVASTSAHLRGREHCGRGACLDFWKVVDGKIVDNWVMVDFPHVMAQLGVDVFNGEGWEAFDRGERMAPRPDAT